MTTVMMPPGRLIGEDAQATTQEGAIPVRQASGCAPSGERGGLPPIFKGHRLGIAVRILTVVSGGLSLAGLIFLPFEDIQLRTIGILGYAGLSPVVFLLVAKVLGRAESRSEEAALSPGPRLGT